MEGLGDSSKVCRLCLQGGEVMCPIFSPSKHNNGMAALPHRIMSCAKVKLVEGDGLPSNVCTSCLAQVDRSYQFKLLCERSELTLRGGIKAESSSDTESDGGEHWDMTKFTPEVIIKEDADEGTLVENGFPSPGQLDTYLSHQHNHPHHPLYPLHQVEELLRNHGTEIKVQADQLHDGNNTVGGEGNGPTVPVTLGQPTALLVAHRLVPVISHQQGGTTPGGPTATTAVLVATTAPPSTAVQQQQQSQKQQGTPQQQQTKVTLLAATPVPVTQPQQNNGSVYQNHQLQQQQHLFQQQQKQHQQVQNELLHHSSLDSTLNSKSRRCRGGDKLFKCSQCNKSYSFSSALSRHKAVHNKDLRPHICKICNKGFTHSDKLLRHQKTHTMDVFMNCDVCNRPFKSYPAYQKHKQTGNCEAASTVNDTSGNVCELCNLELNPHKPHVCNGGETNTISASEASFRQPPASGENSPSSTPHNREQPVDTEEDPSESPPPTSPPPTSRRTKGKSDFKCKVCLKYFATKGSLEVHSTIHTGVRPFVCSACGKSFRHKVNLMEHFQRKHSQVRPYICDVCAARFVTKQELVRHYRKHIGD